MYSRTTAVGAVQTVLGVHLLKEMFNLTDDRSPRTPGVKTALAPRMRLDMEETHLPQKTLHIQFA